MAVTEYEPTHLGGRNWRLRYISSLGGTPTYYIWRNGVLIDTTTATTYDVFVDVNDRVQFDILDTAATPSITHECFATVWWNGKSDAVSYSVEQRKDGGAWAEIVNVIENGSNVYRIKTAELVAGSTYDWRITATDVNGNATGTPMQFTKYIDRAPNQPDWDYTWDADAGEITITV